MNNNTPLRVVRSDGVFGTLTPAEPTPDGQLQMRASFEDGATLLVANTSLLLQQDGTYVLSGHVQTRGATAEQPISQRATATPIVLPVVEETLNVEKRQVATGGIRVRKLVREHSEVVEEPLFQESVDVERVPRDEWVQEGVSLQPRQEGDTLIIPVVEEVIVLQKRLRLVEEIRITKRSQTSVQPQSVTLRREEVVVEPLQQVMSNSTLAQPTIPNDPDR